MKLHLIDEYTEREKNFGDTISKELLSPKHTINESTALFPEYRNSLKRPFGLHRPGVNLAAMLFLYNHVIAYVPPMKRIHFKERFGVDYKTFIELSYPSNRDDRFIFPILNHPRKYRNSLIVNELSEILINYPPSWERWHQALYSTGGNKWFDEADSKFDYKSIWQLPDLRRYWQKKLSSNSNSYISKEIKQQIRNNYTDLCLIGKSELANEIAQISNSQPELAINDLIYSSDLFAYPKIMGGGGYANVRTYGDFPEISANLANKIKDWIPEIKHYDSTNLEILLEGLKFNEIPNEFALNFLKEWHKSSNAKKARETYSTILNIANNKNISLEKLHTTLTTIITELNEFSKNARQIKKVELNKAGKFNNSIMKISASGGIVSTLIGLYTYDIYMAITSGLFTIVGATTWKKKEKIINHLLKRHLPQIPQELYFSYEELRKSKNDIYLKILDYSFVADGFDSSSISTSKPVRSVWFSKTI